MMPVAALQRMFRSLKDLTKIVVLNACYTAEQAKIISEFGMYVVGNNLPITVDAGERLHDDRLHADEPWLHRRMFPAAAFAVVFFAENDGANTSRLVRTATVRHGHELGLRATLAVVGHAVRLLVEGVERTDEAVVGDVLQVPPELQPRPGHRDMVGGAFALRLDEDAHIAQLLRGDWLERRQQLQALRGRADVYLHLAAIGGRCLEASVFYVKTFWWQLNARWWVEAHRHAVFVDERIGQRVEGQVASDGERRHDFRAGHESRGCSGCRRCASRSCG